jgi:SAM-dependent methyltransferase
MSKVGSLYRKALTAVTDLRFGGYLLNGNLETSYAHLGAYSIESTGYDVLPALFRDRVKDDDVLVDIGCGKGRVLNWWLSHFPKHQIFGIELEQSIGQQTRNRMRNYKNVGVLLGDARKLIPPNGTLFYLNNPFNAVVMREFMAELLKIPAGRIIYHNCTCIDLFRADQRFSVHAIPVDGYELPRAFIEFDIPSPKSA